MAQKRKVVQQLKEGCTTKAKQGAEGGEAAVSAPCPVDAKLAASVEENEELTAQQKDFCLYFMRKRNATQAYLKAHDCAYSTAMVESSRSLRNPKIKEELQRLREIKNAALGGLCFSGVCAPLWKWSVPLEKKC